jgi:ribosome-associated protein
MREPNGRPGPVTRAAPEPVTLDQVRRWCVLAARACWEKGGEDTVVLSVGRTLAITDAFVITSGRNPRAIRTMAEEVEAKVKQEGGPGPGRIEGLDDARWVLMDYGDFVVHLLAHEARDFYELDRLWSDVERWEWHPPLAAGE